MCHVCCSLLLLWLFEGPAQTGLDQLRGTNFYAQSALLPQAIAHFWCAIELLHQQLGDAAALTYQRDESNLQDVMEVPPSPAPPFARGPLVLGHLPQPDREAVQLKAVQYSRRSSGFCWFHWSVRPK